MSCGPCKEEVSCEEIPEDDPEYEALTRLYDRMFNSRGDACCPADPAAGHAYGAPPQDPPDRGHCECLLTPSSQADVQSAPTVAHDYCHDPSSLCNSPIKRADRLLTAALLRQRKDGASGGGAAAEGDVKHLTDALPAFKSCKPRKPGTLNSALFGLDLEHWMTAATGGDGRDDGASRAAYDLAAAEAYCKHAGAVEAAEIAVIHEPAGHLAEVAARFGAQSYSGAGGSGGSADCSGGDGGDSTPVVVVAYVGSTSPSPDDE
ncbi:Uncharacterized protein FWK35_00036582 [Aphis craccivora]|uniref:Uncharacterized protein n=1 Tax=Aphis craccivora TaxID=307492 RepID=A0A6G0Z4Y6_APHCR|nr:Uncharacterized protein FWK35_00036582 [Aphis craccivora]